MNFLNTTYYKTSKLVDTASTDDTPANKSIIYTFDNIQQLINTLSHCYTNHIPCILTDDSLSHTNLPTNDIIIIYNDKIYQLSWNLLIDLNNFFANKFNTKAHQFRITNTFFNIFFLKFIDTYHTFITNTASSLVLNGTNYSIFGIYHSYQDHNHSNIHSLYFSFNLFTFILYRVSVSYNSKYIIGKLIPNLSHKDNSLIIYNKSYHFPQTFLHIRDNIFAVQKRQIQFKITKKTNLIHATALSSYHDFCLKFNNQNIYYILTEQNITKYVLEKLFKYIITKYPHLKHSNNLVLFEPNTFQHIHTHFSLYIKTISNKQTLIVHINQHLSPYLNSIVQTIYIFLNKLVQHNHINIHQISIHLKPCDKRIHLISEIYYSIKCIILFIPRIFPKIKISTQNEYIQANYIFSPDEIKLLYANKNESFHTHALYLKSILLKTLSVFMENYYCIIQSNDALDIIPIFNNMPNHTILNLLNRSSKAHLSKHFLLSFLFSMFMKLNNDRLELPIIFMNIYEIHSPFHLSKIYSQSLNKNIPIFINIIYNESHLHISLSYKKNYSQFKYIFNEIISQLLES